MYSRRWVLIFIELVSYCVAVYSEIQAFLHFYSMILACKLDEFNVTMVELETMLLVCSVFAYVVVEMLIDKLDSLS